MKKIVLFTLSALVSAASFGQILDHKICGTDAHLEEIFLFYPDLRAHYEDQQILAQQAIYNGEAKSTGEYEITVVFHVMHMYGNENISDAQVYDALKVLNTEFNAADGDSIDLVAPFDTLHANTRLTLKLAAKDPFGNCTNGIEHIYTHETNIGDAFSKVNQWNRSKYLNIWVCQVVGAVGAAAYAVKPAGTDGSGFWLDGVMSNHSYVGSIGTSSPFTESTLTHEIGHCMNLSHPWGDNNDPGVACGDDGVDDTPETAGWTYCPLGSADNCNPGTQEDLQNYMDYAYCDRHFTPGQVEFMHNALEGIAGQRNILWQDSTLIFTGVKDLVLPQDPANELSVPLCVPVADFHTPDQAICLGATASFEDASWNAVIDSRLWDFGTDASPQTSTSATPTVTWTTPGYKTVTLTVTNAAGQDTKTLTNYIYVSPDWADYTGPVSMDIEGDQHYRFIVQNPEFNYGKYKVVNGSGYDNSQCFKLGNFKDVSNADDYTEDWFYNNRLGLSVDNLISPAVDLSNTTAITVRFKWAYATNATAEADIEEQLKVYSSRNCGESWTARKTLTGTDVVTAGFAGNVDFTPANNLMWREESFSYTATAADTKTRFLFEFTASDLSSNLYIDDIVIDGVLGINDVVLQNLELTVYPNPSQGEAINVSYNAGNQPTEFILRDVQGKIIAQQVISTTNAQVSQSLSNTEDLSSAPYFLEVKSGDHSMTKKIVVL